MNDCDFNAGDEKRALSTHNLLLLTIYIFRALGREDWGRGPVKPMPPSFLQRSPYNREVWRKGDGAGFVFYFL